MSTEQGSTVGASAEGRLSRKPKLGERCHVQLRVCVWQKSEIEGNYDFCGFIPTFLIMINLFSETPPLSPFKVVRPLLSATFAYYICYKIPRIKV